MTSPPPSSRWIRATVLAGGAETSYLRAGSGSAVVLLISRHRGASDTLLDDLSRMFRVIAPLIPESVETDVAELARWLEGVLEALGLAAPALLVEPRFERAARLALPDGAIEVLSSESPEMPLVERRRILEALVNAR